MNASGLKDYQAPAVESLLRALYANGGALDGSDMGVGKTYHAAAVIRELNVPTLVAVPAVALTGWKRALEHLGTSADVQSLDLLRGGNTPWGWWDNPRPAKLPAYLQCIACQCKSDAPFNFPCPHHHSGIHCVKPHKHEHPYGKFNWHPNIKLLVVDEVHRCGAMDSLQGDMLVAAKRQRIAVLGMSATVCDSPLGLRAIGYCLGLHSLVDSGKSPGFYRWAQGYGCRRLPMLGFQWALGDERKREAMLRLHREIFPARGVRVRISDLGDKFPECQITAELIDLNDGGRLASLYDQMAVQIRLMNERRDRDASGPLSEFLRLRQEIGLLKVPVMADMAREMLAAGRHVALFVNFRAEVDALCALLKTDCRVDGSQVGPKGQRQREANIEAFGEDKEPFIVLTAAAGGISISLQDRYGNFPRGGVVSPGHSAREFRQVCGRLPRQGGKSKSIYRVLFAAGTRDERGHRLLSPKLNNLDTLNDGDLLPIDNLPLTAFGDGVS